MPASSPGCTRARGALTAIHLVFASGLVAALVAGVAGSGPYPPNLWWGATQHLLRDDHLHPGGTSQISFLFMQSAFDIQGIRAARPLSPLLGIAGPVTSSNRSFSSSSGASLATGQEIVVVRPGLAAGAALVRLGPRSRSSFGAGGLTAGARHRSGDGRVAYASLCVGMLRPAEPCLFPPPPGQRPPRGCRARRCSHRGPRARGPSALHRPAPAGRGPWCCPRHAETLRDPPARPAPFADAAGRAWRVE